MKFDNVSVPRSALSYVGTSADFDRTQARGYTWFELCISSAARNRLNTGGHGVGTRG